MSKYIKTSIENFLNENLNRLPQYLYHITSASHYESIKKDGGLDPKYSK